MSELREAAQAVVSEFDDWGNTEEDMEAAIDRLRAVLAQPKTAEPVAWQARHIDWEDGPGNWTETQDPNFFLGRKTYEVRPLYAHPPRDEWRLASEPPEDGTPVIIWFASGGFTKAIALRGKWITAGGRERKEEEVTHWRDVQPPAEGER